MHLTEFTLTLPFLEHDLALFFLGFDFNLSIVDDTSLDSSTIPTALL